MPRRRRDPSSPHHSLSAYLHLLHSSEPRLEYHANFSEIYANTDLNA